MQEQPPDIMAALTAEAILFSASYSLTLLTAKSLTSNIVPTLRVKYPASSTDKGQT